MIHKHKNRITGGGGGWQGLQSDVEGVQERTELQGLPQYC